MRRIGGKGSRTLRFIDTGYSAKANTYKAQLHCHSTGSDGADTPAAIVTAYRDAGYDAVCLTDHDVKTADPAVPSVLFIPGHEEAASQGHMSCINSVGDYVATTVQAHFDVFRGGAVREIPVLNHPNAAGNLWTEAERDGVTDSRECAIELYNARRDATPAQAYAEDVIDRELTLGRRYNLLATDDCHGITNDEFNKAWAMVHADSLTLANILTALRAGNFYSTQGPTITVSLSGRRLTVTTGAAATIEFIADNAVVKTASAATSAYYDIPEDGIKYVRARVTRDSDSKKAWSNPLYLRNVTSKEAKN